MGAYDNAFLNDLYGGRGYRSNSVPEIDISGMYYFDIEGQNAVVEQWTPKVTRALRQSARWFSDGKDESFVTRGAKSGHPHGESKLAASIVSRTKKDAGTIDRITFNFERHGVFVHKGVGRGYRKNGEFVTRYAKGPETKPRVAVEWFNPVLERMLPELANRLAEVNADAVINAKQMRKR